MSLLLEPYTLRQLTLPNRIAVSPMCQYSAVDGLANDWHLVHLGSRAVGGAGLVITEAVAVTAIGRITAEDLGLWEDAQIAPLQRITRFITAQGAVPGIQLAHAGRKASTYRPWLGKQGSVKLEEGGWQPVGPSKIAFDPQHTPPHELTPGRDPGCNRGVRRLDRARLEGRFQGGGNSCCAWLPVAPVPLTVKQPAPRRVRQLFRKPHPPDPAGGRGRAQGVACRVAAVGAGIGNRLGGGRLEPG